MSVSSCVCCYFLLWPLHINLVGGFHLELVHGRAGLGDVELAGILTGHNDFLLLFECLVGFVAFGYRKHSFAGFFVGMQSERR